MLISRVYSCRDYVWKTLPRTAQLLAVILLLTSCGSVPSDSSQTVSTDQSFQGRMVWRQMRIDYDPPGVIFRALFDNPDKLRKDSHEARSLYEQRIEAINACDETFVILIPPEFCEYWYEAGQGQYTIVSRDPDIPEADYVSGLLVRFPYGITVSESGPGELETGSNPAPYREVWKLALPDFEHYPAELVQRPDDGNKPAHFGLSFHYDSQAFVSRLTDRKIGLALRFRIGDCRNAYEHVDGLGIGASDSNITTTDYLPIELLDVWIIDTGTDYSLIQWSRDN